METALVIATIVLAALNGIIGVLVLVAPLTRSDLDNRALAFLRKLAAVVAKLVGNK
jgi:hypothetical protein